MHLEFLVEDASGAELMRELIPKIIGFYGDPHTWHIHSYKGVGHVPKGLASKPDPAKRVLLNQLPRLLAGHGRTPGTDLVVVVVDADGRDCKVFLEELRQMLSDCDPAPSTLFRIAIEEIEAWYFGDKDAILASYPLARRNVLDDYRQDSICGTWEWLADALVKGGSAGIKKQGWPAPGQLKFEWAQRIGPLLDVNHNTSPSFGKLRDGLRRAVGRAPTTSDE